MTNQEHIREAVKYVKDEFGKLDVLANSMRPGWVSTDMDGRWATLSVRKGVGEISGFLLQSEQ